MHAFYGPQTGKSDKRDKMNEPLLNCTYYIEEKPIVSDIFREKVVF